MKRILLTMILAAMTVCSLWAQNGGKAGNRGFKHPGCIVSQDEIDRTKARIAAGDSVATNAFKYLKESKYAQIGYSTYAVETIVRGGDSGQNYMVAARGACAAWEQGILWRLTGNDKYAESAVAILNSWAKTCKWVTGDSNYALAAGIYGYEFANAGELLRDYEGWSEEDFAEFQNWMRKVWYTPAIGFLRGRNGTWENSGKWWQAPGHYWSNWGLCNALCVMSIGVLCDDVFIYNQGLSFYKYDQCGTFKDQTPEEVAAGDGYVWSWGLTEYLGNLVPIVSQTPDSLLSTPWGEMSQMQESGRDQGHTAMALGLAVDICQLGLNQGDDLYAYMDNRLAGGIEHVAAYNAGGVNNLPFVKYIRQSNGFTVADGRGGVMTGDSEASRPSSRPCWDRILAYYGGRKGVTMPYAEMAREQVGIDLGPGYLGETSGGFDHLGFTTLLCRRDKADASQAEVTLIPSMTYDGKTVAHNELGGLVNTFTPNSNSTVAAGTEIVLTASLPEGESDTGQWVWDTGETGNSLTITADSSRIYRVTYTAANGTQSEQCFSIAVRGDVPAEGVSASMTYNDATYNDTTLQVVYGRSVTMTVTADYGWGTYAWNTKTSGNSVTCSKVTQDSTFVCTYTNPGGTQTVTTFLIQMVKGQQYIGIGTDEMQQTASAVAEVGDSITLQMLLPSGVLATRVLWDGGAKGRTYKIDSLATTTAISCQYAFQGDTLHYTFTVYALTEEDSLIPNGNYYIRHVPTDTYLTNPGDGTAPFFSAENTSDMTTQTWYIGHLNQKAQYNLQSMTDSLYLKKDGTLLKYTARPWIFKTAKNCDYWAPADKDGKIYWLTTADGTLDLTTMTSIYGFDYEIIPATETTAIAAIVPSQAPVTEVRYYAPNGQRLSAPQKGITLVQTVRSDGTATTQKILRP